MKSRLMVVFIASLLLTPIIPFVFADTDFNVKTVERYYKPGETVQITVTGSAGAKALLTMNATDKKEILRKEITLSGEGSFTESYVLKDTDPKGVYHVSARIENERKLTTFVVTSADVEKLATDYLTAAESSRTSARALITDLEGEGVKMPSAVEEQMKHGEEALARANDLKNQGAAISAMEAAQRAGKHFENAMKIALVAAKHEAKPISEDMLRERINKANRLLDKMRELLERIREKITEEEASTIKGYLDAADTLLASAMSKVDTDIKGAEKDLADARKSLGDAWKELMKFVMVKKQMQMKRFLEQMQLRMDRMEELIGRLRTKLGPRAGDFEAKFREKLGKLSQLKEKLNSKGMTVEELEEIVGDLEDDFDGIGNSWGRLMKEMNKVHAGIQSMEGTMAEMQSKGQSIKDIKERIILSAQAMDRAVWEMEKGAREDAMARFSEAWSTLSGNHFGWMMGLRSNWGKLD